MQLSLTFLAPQPCSYVQQLSIMGTREHCVWSINFAMSWRVIQGISMPVKCAGGEGRHSNWTSRRRKAGSNHSTPSSHPAHRFISLFRLNPPSTIKRRTVNGISIHTSSYSEPSVPHPVNQIIQDTFSTTTTTVHMHNRNEGKCNGKNATVGSCNETTRRIHKELGKR